MYLRFVLRSKDGVFRIKKHLPTLQTKFSDLKCVSANLQPIPHAILEGPEEIFLTEIKTIEHRIGPYSLKLSPQAFVQTGFSVAEKLYETAGRWISEVKPARFLELFSGQGGFSFFASESAGQALGIEINRDAVETANQTAQALGLSHLTFVESDVAQVEAAARGFAPDFILANPPRRGLGESVEWIARLAPQNFIYSSCAVDTLATDLKKLDALYRIKRAQIFDLFAHTEHFETLVWLEKR